MTTVRPAAGGGRTVEVAPERLTGWLNRFAVRHGGISTTSTTLSSIQVTARDGSVASLAVPFPPMSVAPAVDALPGPEPVEALLEHLGDLGTLAVVLIRGAAFSVGLCRGGIVTASSTDSRYLHGRTAAGGWSQQRYQRRRGNQRRQAQEATSQAAARVLKASSSEIRGLVTGGDATSVAQVLADHQLEFLQRLPRRDFPDLREPRRSVLEHVAVRALTVPITIRDGDATPQT